MSKKKRLPVLVAIVCVAIVLLYLINRYTTAQSIAQNNPPQNNSPSPEGNLLVVPESQLGTAGLISALAASLAIFIMMKKGKPSIPNF